MLNSRQNFISTTILLVVFYWIAPPATTLAQFDFEKAPILYSDSTANDAIAKLNSKLDAGELTFSWDEKSGWLRSLLQHLDVSTKSQTLVFSKTSLQLRHINPGTPRAIYFNDESYVAWIPTAEMIELSAVDDRLGAVFYTIKQQHSERPVIERDHTSCMSCHGTSKTKNVPGYFVRSVFTSQSGQPFFSMGSTTTDHETDLEKRFGGWFVTGTHGQMKHRGNKIVEKESTDPFDWKQHANVTDLNQPERILDTRRYPEPTSDIVALMVLEHQSQMHNMITRAGYETRQALHYQRVMNDVLKRDADFESETTIRRIHAAGDKLVKYMLFSGEIELTEPITGSNSFAQDFEKIGPRDEQGRSLREFDLTKRMFKYPCSFLVYSSSFDQLPPKVFDYVANRLLDVLVGDDDSDDFQHLSTDDRAAILEILLDTKPVLRKRWESRSKQ